MLFFTCLPSVGDAVFKVGPPVNKMCAVREADADGLGALSFADFVRVACRWPSGGGASERAE